MAALVNEDIYKRNMQELEALRQANADLAKERDAARKETIIAQAKYNAQCDSWSSLAARLQDAERCVEVYKHGLEAIQSAGGTIASGAKCSLMASAALREGAGMKEERGEEGSCSTT